MTRLSIACSTAALALALTSAAAPALVAMGGGNSQIMSPVALMSRVTERGTDGRPRLRLLIFWRGQPGWFLRPGGRDHHTTSTNGESQSWITRGDVGLTFSYSLAKRTVVINGHSIALGDRNVVLVDDVDTPSGPRIVEILQIESRMPGSEGQVGQMLGQYPALMSFLRCDARSADPRHARILERLCLQNIGIER